VVPGGMMTCPARCTGKLSSVTVVETILVYVVAPLAVIAVLALLTLVPGRHKRPRYKPGQAWEHEPIWYEPHPESTGGSAGGHLALPAGSTPAAGPRGGARGTW
jgi:hypothetical protein